MIIYVTHSTSFDFKKELYEPLRSSDLNNKHNIVLPHEKTDQQFVSKSFLKECDLVIAEVSNPSTGQGIELGWASLYNKKIICIHKKNVTPSKSLNVVSNVFISYTDSTDLIKQLEKVL
jgi:hypothetical protein